MAMIGPTFQAIWPDGTKTRMTVHCDDEKLDLGRGVRLSWAAYQSRTKGKGRDIRIKEGHFERDGMVFQTYENLYVGDHGINPLEG